MLGGRACLQQEAATIFRKPPNLRQQLLTFTKHAKRVTDIFARPGDKLLFKPAKCSDPRLHAYGIDRHIPCICAEICLNTQHAEHMHKALTSIRADPTRKNNALLAQGKLRVLSGPLSKRGIPPWQRLGQGGYLTKSVDNYKEKVRALPHSSSYTDACPVPVFLSCHDCGHCRDVQHIDLVHNAKWKPLYCKRCRINRKASKWLCECGMPWHACTVHRDIGFSCHKVLKTTPLGSNKPTIRKSIPLGIMKQPKRRRATTHVPSPSKRHRYLHGDISNMVESSMNPPNSLLQSSFVPSGGHVIGQKRRDPQTIGGTLGVHNGPKKSRTDVGHKSIPKTGNDVGNMHIVTKLKCRAGVGCKDISTRESDVGNKHITACLPRNAKRGLPVAWGQGIFKKCPKLAARFSSILQPQLPRPPEEE